MSTDLVAAQPAAVLSDESRGILERLLVVRDVLAPDLTVSELQLFALVSARSGLDPFARQIYAVKRNGRMTIQTGIDGYRSIAARTGEYDGQDEPVYGPACGCGKPPSPHPEWATVRVYRKGVSRAIAATAYWHEYVPDPGPSGRGDQMWRKMPHVMIAKVAEALALRKAFPWDPTRGIGIGADIYTTEEMAQAESAPVVSVQERVASRAAALRSGLTVREFAEAVSDLDPEVVRKERDRLFPGRTVSELTDEERQTLLTELRLGPVDADERAREALMAEEAEHEILAEQDEAVEEPQTCPVASPLDGAACDRERGHRGPHRSADLKQSW